MIYAYMRIENSDLSVLHSDGFDVGGYEYFINKASSSTDKNLLEVGKQFSLTIYADTTISKLMLSELMAMF